MIQNQNSQPWGVITIFAGAAVAAELLLRTGRLPQPKGRLPTNVGAPLVLLAFLLPTSIHCFMALCVHTAAATLRVGEPFGLPRFDGLRLTTLWVPGDRSFMTAYLASIQEGARLLGELPFKPEHVSVLDFANPFSAGLGLPPPRGDNAWLHWGRNVNDAHFLPPEQLLGNVSVLMEPKWGINNLPLSSLYGNYIREAFEPVRETDLWIVHRRRDTKALSRSAPSMELEQLSRVGAGDGISR
jgi:hypothetical protein